MLKKKITTLWGAFVTLVFLIMLSSTVIMSFVAFISFRLDIMRPHGPGSFLPVVTSLLTSLIMGTIITVLTAEKILSPLENLKDGFKAVAKGNFQVFLKENNTIGEFRTINQNFNKMVHQLNSIETLRSDFVVNVSHEFKTPLSAIEGYATLLQDPSLTEIERNEYTKIIIDSVRQLSSLSTNILNLSKLENQDRLEHKNEFDLDEQIRQILLLLEPQWSGKNINLNIDLPPCKINSSEELLHQVWINLLANAIKFTPNYGEIHVSIDQTNTSCHVIIADSGIGISQKDQEHVFEKFYQADPSRSSSGNGLGLALVKRIVYLCNGQILLESSPGKGSKFIVILPKR